MKALVTYDSAYGNTARIAKVVGVALSELGETSVRPVTEVTERDMTGLDLLVIGSPTNGGMPTKPTQQFIDEIPKELFNLTKIAIFDTRFDIQEQKLALRILMRSIGYAATKMATSVRQQGGTVLSEPIGFIVTEKEGPLRHGELEKASAWASQLGGLVR